MDKKEFLGLELVMGDIIETTTRNREIENVRLDYFGYFNPHGYGRDRSSISTSSFMNQKGRVSLAGGEIELQQVISVRKIPRPVRYDSTELRAGDIVEILQETLENPLWQLTYLLSLEPKVFAWSKENGVPKIRRSPFKVLDLRKIA